MYTFFIIVLVIMGGSFLCSFFCFTFIFVCMKFGLCKEFVDTMFLDYDNKINDSVKTLIVTPVLSIAPTCVAIAGMLYYMGRYPIQLIMTPLMKLYGFMDNTISKEASKQEFKKKLEKKTR